MSRKELRERNILFLEKVTDKIMWWIGSVPSLVAHTLVFITAFLLPIFGIVSLDKMLLVLTTVLSLEAIYFSIFIQMSVNRSHEHIEDIREDIEEIQDDIEEISEDIDDIQEDIEDIAEDEDEDDHIEKARNVMLKSNVSSNKNDIKALRGVISNLQEQLEDLKKNDENTEQKTPEN
ncbi:hypothetical protein AP75_04355 [Kaistella haifensis DSM 19056]|uniref:DUF1003 domain-containing protein n=1 Tax=Kaistella haifensis DSM 19056 TaxID=1450526 RepID=A0A246BAI5_9FLAO|nr:DUF1003 domain-containing protein [Kaistella haifensis]OWK98702.1 hypothetical protein AP75_04355 [Kaistella haifensis DSM 19056]